MASLLDSVDAHRKANWQLPARENLRGEGNPWEELVIVYNALAPYFTSALEEERAILQEALEKLATLVDGLSGREVDAAVRRFLHALSDAGVQPNSGLDENAKPAFGNMEQTVTIIRNLVQEDRISMFAPAVSGVLPYSDRFNSYVDYLTRLAAFAEQRLQRWQAELDQAGGQVSEIERTRTAINQRYQELAAKLEALIEEK